MFILDDTIAALASAAGSAGRGIIRCSGPEVWQMVQQRFEPADAAAWGQAKVAARHPGIWRLAAPVNAFPLPVDLYYWPTPRSYTGQRQIEIHTLGSPPLLGALLSDLFSLGARPAEPGEFTLRAFLAGRMDLVQAEAVLGVIDADDQHELQTALAQLAGGISQRLTAMRSEFLDLLADLEAGLDFTEEGLDFVERPTLVQRISDARDELVRLQQRASSRSHHQVRARVVICGQPNAGKSTLFNALAERDAALVSPIAGTTRDYLTCLVTWDGLTIELVDTAGFEETPDEILRAGMSLGTDQVAHADLLLHCRPADEPPDARDETSRWIDKRILKLTIVTKCDLTVPTEMNGLGVSAQTGRGLPELRAAVLARLRDRSEGESDLLGSTAARCHDSLENAIAALTRAADLAEQGGGDEFLATDVREALEELGRITGAVYTDDLLDRIFSKFCIGK